MNLDLNARHFFNEFTNKHYSYTTKIKRIYKKLKLTFKFLKSFTVLIVFKIIYQSTYSTMNYELALRSKRYISQAAKTLTHTQIQNKIQQN